MRGSFVGGVLAAMGRTYTVWNYDIVVAVSSGSCSAAYYVTETGEDNLAHILQIWRWELIGSKLISFLNPLRGKTFLDQEYLIDHLFGSKYPLLRERFDEPERPPLYVGVSNMHTLEPEYLRATGSNIFKLLKAATALPIATRGHHRLGESLYTDGGALDPLPVEAVLRAGYRDLTVILTNPQHSVSEPVAGWLSRLAYPRHRTLAQLLNRRQHVMANRAYDLVRNPPEGVKMRVIAPDKPLPASLVNTNERRLNHSVDLGLAAGYAAFAREARTRRNRAIEWLSALKRRLFQTLGLA